MAGTNEVCYRCGSWKDDYPSTLCNYCRARLHDDAPTGDPVAALQIRMTDDDRLLLWIAGIKVDGDLMELHCTMTCPRCREVAHKAKTEDSFRCGCGWDSNTRCSEEKQWQRELSSHHAPRRSS